VVVPAEVVVVAVTAGAVAVVVDDEVVLTGCVGVEVVVSVLAAMFAFPPQPATPRASATMMAIADLFIGSS
jgi:hypothetical protein